MNPSRSDRNDAAAIVEWVLGVRATPVGRPEDGFRLTEGTEAVGALHVACAPVDRRGIGRIACAAPELERSWLLDLAAGIEPGDGQTELRARLLRLERAGVSHFGPLADGALDREAANAILGLVSLGVVSGVGVHAGEHPRVIRTVTNPDGTDALRRVNDVVEDEAWRHEVRQRLERAAGTAHLFVWVSDTDIDARSAMQADEPLRHPVLPPEVGSAWIARRSDTADDLLADRVWQTDEDGKWQALGSIRATVSLTTA